MEELYNNGTPSNLSNHSATSNLVSWWKLNNTTTGIEDAKGSNNGTNYGATEYAGFVNKLVVIAQECLKQTLFKVTYKQLRLIVNMLWILMGQII